MLTLTESRPGMAECAKERRLFHRVTGQRRVEARRMDHTVLAHRQPRLHLQLRDVSVSGLSAISLEPAARGEHVGVHFPGEGGMGGWGAMGRVVRCEPAAEGYHLALEFDPLPAA